jgi:GAF domain-containing protein
MGYDAVSHQRNWETDTVTVLRTIGETFITTIERIKLEKEIQATFERRGYQVQISTEISQEIATASELNELFERVVTLTKERLGYYHTQLLRYDTAQDAVALIKGYGETGQKMLADGHKLPLGIGLIGTAAATGETVLRSTLADDPDWQPNPLLPETKGEIAVPIKWQNAILGVLDVQSDRAGALTEDDRLLLEGLCGQVAVAIEQTRLRAEMTERLEEVNRLYRSMSREGWKTYRETENLPTGFMFDQTGVRTMEDVAFTGESFTNVPMKVMGGEVVGNLAVVNDPQSPMSQEDLDFLQQVSEQVALALEGARLSAQTQSALAQTEKLSEAGLLFTRASDLQEVVKIAVETLGISQINRAVLETFNYNSANDVEGIDVIANWWNGTGLEPTVVGTHYTFETLPLLRQFLTPTPLFMEDAFHDNRVDNVSMEVVKKLNIHAVAVLPLFLADRQLGVLLLESEEVHEFNQDETRLFSAMGPQISTVLENRRQFERARQQAEREGMLNLISQKIQSATTVEAVLQIAARELGHALGAPMTIAQLSMKDRK